MARARRGDASQAGAVPSEVSTALAARRRTWRPCLAGVPLTAPAGLTGGVARYALDPDNASRLWDLSLRMLAG